MKYIVTDRHTDTTSCSVCCNTPQSASVLCMWCSPIMKYIAYWRHSFINRMPKYRRLTKKYHSNDSWWKRVDSEEIFNSFRHVSLVELGDATNDHITPVLSGCSGFLTGDKWTTKSHDYSVFDSNPSSTAPPSWPRKPYRLRPNIFRILFVLHDVIGD